MVADSYEVLVKQINNACEIAVKNTAEIMMEKLKEFMQTKYYDLYAPKFYIPRTYKFLNSAVYKMLNNQTALIGIDDSYFDYEYPSNYRLLGNDNNPSGEIGHWTGEDQVYAAEYGMHGNANIYTDGHYWSEFIGWCNTNAVPLLIKNLKEQGVSIE